MAFIKSRKHSIQPGLLCTTAVGLLVAAPIQAADTTEATAEKELPAVVVNSTAIGASDYKPTQAASPKLSQPLLNTTQTITAVTKEVLRDQGATTLAEAVRNSPGLTLLLGENGNTSAGENLFMRGFSVSNSIFVDNIRDMGAITHDVFNVEQVEIAKGPAGADNGRGTASGYINLVSKVPVADNFSNASVSYGSADRKRVTADLNRRVGEDKTTALRLNVMAQDGGVAGRDTVHQRSWGFAPSLALGLKTDTRAYIYFQHVQQDNLPDGGVPTVGLPGYYNATLAPGVVPARVDSSNFYGHESDYEDIKADMFTVRFEHDLKKGLTVRNITRYGKTSMDRLMTGIPTNGNNTAAQEPIRLEDADPNQWFIRTSLLNTNDATSSSARQSIVRENELLTNQTSFTADFKTGGIEHTLVGGVEFIYEKQDNVTRNNLGIMADTNLYNPEVVFTTDPNPTPSGARNDGSTTTVAGYLFDTLKINDKVQLNGALRLERYNTTYESVTLSTATSHPSLPVGTPVPTQLQSDDLLTSWKLGALYKPVPEGSLYVAYANSQKPPGNDNFTLATSTSATSETGNANNPALDPQEASNIEAGVKWELFQRRLAVNAAVYRSVNKNDLSLPDAADNTVIHQYGKRSVQGVELSAGGNVTTRWQVTGGIAYMDTEVEEGSRLATPTSNQEGAQIQWTPKISASLWNTYSLPFGLTLGAGVRYTDSVARQTNNNVVAGTQMPEMESYWVVDAMAAYKINRNISVQLNIYNLTDEDYVAMLNNSGRRYMPGTPRSALLTANFTY